MAEKKKIPVKEGLWIETDKGPRLIGSKCQNCGEVFFPKKVKGMCLNCRSTQMKDIELSPEGTIFTFTKVMIQPGGDYYHGPVPYANGYVELPDGVRIQTLFPEEEMDMLKIGKKVKLYIDKLWDDKEGNEVMTYKYRLAEVQK